MSYATGVPPAVDGTGRILRPSERFANTGAFGDSGVFGQGGSLTSPRSKPINRNNTYDTLSPGPLSPSSSSTSLTFGPSTASSSRHTPSKKKFFSFGRSSGQKDFSSSALSDEEGPRLSASSTKRFSRFSRSIGTADSGSGKKRSKSAGAAPRPSLTSQEPTDEWIVLSKREALPDKTTLAKAAESTKHQQQVQAGDWLERSRVPAMTPPSVRSASPSARAPMQQIQRPLPTSPPFYANPSIAQMQKPAGQLRPLAASLQIPAAHKGDLFSPPPPSVPKEGRRQSSVPLPAQNRSITSVPPNERPTIPDVAVIPAFAPHKAGLQKRDRSRSPAERSPLLSPQQADAHKILQKPVEAAASRPVPASTEARASPMRQRLGLTEANLSAHSIPASPVDDKAHTIITACVGKPRFEDGLCQAQILTCLFDHIDYPTFRALTRTSSRLRAGLARQPLAELALERWLGCFGYRTLGNVKPSLQLSVRDMDAFYASTEYSLSEYVMLAMDHKRSALAMPTQRRLRAATRAHSKLVLRLRAQSRSTQQLGLSAPHWATAGLQGSDLFKRGRAAVLRIWVPSAGTWMTDAELLECEREIRRAGLWEHLERGDLVRNVAISDIVNEGVVIFDGRFFRDLSYAHDPLGHLPSWLNGLAYSPAHWHNQLSCTDGQPVIFLDLTPFVAGIQANLTLCKEKAAVTSPSGERYAVNRFMYRTYCEIVPGTMLGDAGGAGGSGPAGIEIVHPDWAGKVVIETEGTAESARDLIARATAGKQDRPNANNQPFKIMRNLSKPGQIWITPVVCTPKKQQMPPRH